MCGTCKEFFKTKQDLQTHVAICSSDPELSGDQILSDNVRSLNAKTHVLNNYFNMINYFQIQYQHCDLPLPMPIEKMRLMIAILLKKISTDKKLKELGFEKVKKYVAFRMSFKILNLFLSQRLIDNILIDSLKIAGRNYHTAENFTEGERLKLNVEEFLSWTIPEETMTTFRNERKSTEEILESLVGGF